MSEEQPVTSAREEFERLCDMEQSLLEQLATIRENQLAAYRIASVGQMTFAQCAVVLHDRRKTEIKAYYEEGDVLLKAARDEFEVAFVQNVMLGEESGDMAGALPAGPLYDTPGPYWQDEEGIVFGVKRCQWKQVKMSLFEVVRTKRADEKSGDLSLTEARERGFEPANAKVKTKRRAEGDGELSRLDEGRDDHKG